MILARHLIGAFVRLGLISSYFLGAAASAEHEFERMDLNGKIVGFDEHHAVLELVNHSRVAVPVNLITKKDLRTGTVVHVHLTESKDIEKIVNTDAPSSRKPGSITRLLKSK